LAQVRLLVKLYVNPSSEEPMAPAWNTHPSKNAPNLKGFNRNEPRSIKLAYVAYFNMSEDVEDDILMYRVSRENRGAAHRRGSVIPLESIARFVQLIPRFDGRADRQISAENSMEICRNYYINSFATQQIFQSVY
jgi:hypothetical protein